MIESGKVAPDRVLRATAPTIDGPFYENGVAVDPGTVTVGITDQAGNVVLAPGATTGGTGTNARTRALTAAQAAELDRLAATWSSSTKGDIVTYVEVVGGFLFSLAEARADPDLVDTTEYTADELKVARTLAESALEDACGRAFVPRYSREVLTGGGYRLTLARTSIRSIRSVTVNGTALTATQIAGLRFDGRHVHYSGGWFSDDGGVVIDYEHGMDFPPPRLARAALILAKNWLIKGPIDDRAVSIPAGDAGGVISLATPGVRGAVFGIPEVDLVVQRYARNVRVG